MDAWAHSIFTLLLEARETTRARGSAESLLLELALINVFNACVTRLCYLHHRTGQAGCAVRAWRRPILRLYIICGFLWQAACVFVYALRQLCAICTLSVSGSGLSTFHKACLCAHRLSSLSTSRCAPPRWSSVMSGLTETLQTTFSLIREARGYQCRGWRSLSACSEVDRSKRRWRVGVCYCWPLLLFFLLLQHQILLLSLHL